MISNATQPPSLQAENSRLLVIVAEVGLGLDDLKQRIQGVFVTGC